MTNMERAIFIAKCSDKSHKYDVKIAADIKKISGIREASAIPDMKIRGTKYCIIARAKVPTSKQLKTIYRRIESQQHLASVKQLTAQKILA